jgi:hypothetical protein
MTENLRKDSVHAFQQARRESGAKYLAENKLSKKHCRETRGIYLIYVSTKGHYCSQLNVIIIKNSITRNCTFSLEQ